MSVTGASNPELPLGSPLYWYESQGTQAFYSDGVTRLNSVVSWEGWTGSAVSKNLLSLPPSRSLGEHSDGKNLLFRLHLNHTKTLSPPCKGKGDWLSACRGTGHAESGCNFLRWKQPVLAAFTHRAVASWPVPAQQFFCSQPFFVDAGASRYLWNSPVFQKYRSIFLEGAFVA